MQVPIGLILQNTPSAVNEVIVAWRLINTLFGEEVVNTAPKCIEPDCDGYADNAGRGRYHLQCSTHHKMRYSMDNWHYKYFRKEYCENIDGRLGFDCTSKILKPTWQLDVDHIDGDRQNNEEKNLQTLCKNCHAYKTMINEENLPMHKRKKYFVNLMENKNYE